MTISTAQDIYDSIMRNGGATVLLSRSGKPSLMGPRDGDVYIVGGARDHDDESIPELFFDLHDFHAEYVEDALRYVRELTPASDFMAAGFWVEDGKVVCDSVDAINRRDLAVLTAAEREERAVFHLSTSTTVYVADVVQSYMEAFEARRGTK